MANRTITGTILMADLVAYPNSPITFELENDFTDLGVTYLSSVIEVMPDPVTGYFTVTLAVPTTPATAIYRVRLVSGIEQWIYLTSGPATDLATLLTLAGSPIAQSALQTVIDAHKLDTNPHAIGFLNIPANGLAVGTDQLVVNGGNVNMSGSLKAHSISIGSTFIVSKNNPIIPGVIEESIIMDGVQCDDWYYGVGGIHYAYSTDVMCEIWTDGNGGVPLPTLAGVRYAYVFKVGATYYLSGVQSGDGNLYLYSSTDKINFSIENGGNPIFHHSANPLVWYYIIYNNAIAVEGLNWHLLIDGRTQAELTRIKTSYSVSTLADGPNFDANISANPVLPGFSGTPDLKYVSDRSALMVMYTDYRSDTIWELRMSTALLASDLSLPASWIEAPGFNTFRKEGIYLTDSHLCFNSSTFHPWKSMLAYCYDQVDGYRAYGQLTIDQLYDVISNPGITEEGMFEVGGKLRTGKLAVRGSSYFEDYINVVSNSLSGIIISQDILESHQGLIGITGGKLYLTVFSSPPPSTPMGIVLDGSKVGIGDSSPTHSISILSSVDYEHLKLSTVAEALKSYISMDANNFYIDVNRNTGDGVFSNPASTHGRINILSTNSLGSINFYTSNFNNVQAPLVMSILGSGNVRVEDGRLELNKGTGNTIVTGGNNTMAGTNNSVIGLNAFASATNGSGNDAIGAYALVSVTSGNSNNAMGASSLGSLITGSANVAIGDEALVLTTSSNNTAVGFDAGYNITTGINNTFLGYNAGHHASQAVGVGNSMALGNGSYTTANNQVVIGDINIVQTLLRGNVLIGTITDGMTAAGSLAIAQDLAHRGTLVGLFNHAPAAQPTKAGHNNWANISDIASALAAIGLIDSA